MSREVHPRDRLALPAPESPFRRVASRSEQRGAQRRTQTTYNPILPRALAREGARDAAQLRRHNISQGRTTALHQAMAVDSSRKTPRDARHPRRMLPEAPQRRGFQRWRLVAQVDRQLHVLHVGPDLGLLSGSATLSPASSEPKCFSSQASWPIATARFQICSSKDFFGSRLRGVRLRAPRGGGVSAGPRRVVSARGTPFSVPSPRTKTSFFVSLLVCWA